MEKVKSFDFENQPIYMLSTIDNPYNYFTDFDNWLNYDREVKHYNTLELLARLVKTSRALSDEYNNYEINEAITDFVSSNPFGIYIRITKDSKIIPIQIEKVIGNS